MPERDPDADYVVIILDLEINNNKIQLGAIADGVKDVIEINDSEIRDIPKLGSNYTTEFITGMAKIIQPHS